MAQFGRARALGAWGRRFKSCYRDQHHFRRNIFIFYGRIDKMFEMKLFDKFDYLFDDVFYRFVGDIRSNRPYKIFICNKLLLPPFPVNLWVGSSLFLIYSILNTFLYTRPCFWNNKSDNPDRILIIMENNFIFGLNGRLVTYLILAFIREIYRLI